MSRTARALFVGSLEQFVVDLVEQPINANIHVIIIGYFMILYIIKFKDKVIITI